MLKGIAETCIYATNLEETELFYKEVLCFEVVMREENRHVFFKCGDDMLLLFNPDLTGNEQTDVGGKRVPLHGATGSVHVAFSVDSGTINSVKERLQTHGISVESEISWPNGSHSVYFRDPAGNSLEIVTENMWK